MICFRFEGIRFVYINIYERQQACMNIDRTIFPLAFSSIKLNGAAFAWETPSSIDIITCSDLSKMSWCSPIMRQYKLRRSIMIYIYIYICSSISIFIVIIIIIIFMHLDVYVYIYIYTSLCRNGVMGLWKMTLYVWWWWACTFQSSRRSWMIQENNDNKIDSIRFRPRYVCLSLFFRSIHAHAITFQCLDRLSVMTSVVFPHFFLGPHLHRNFLRSFFATRMRIFTSLIIVR